MIGLNIYAGMDRSSAKFTSVVGNIDKRVELDKNIRPGNPKYNASLAMMASKLAYENEAFGQATVEDQWRVINYHLQACP